MARDKASVMTQALSILDRAAPSRAEPYSNRNSRVRSSRAGCAGHSNCTTCWKILEADVDRASGLVSAIQIDAQAATASARSERLVHSRPRGETALRRHDFAWSTYSVRIFRP